MKPTITTEQLHQALKHHFGYDQFRLRQLDIIRNVLNGNDVLAVMPTGGGKSICYQLPAILSSGITIVVSPLIALMKDQVDALRANGIAAAFLNSTQSTAEQASVVAEAINGTLKLLYIAPERIPANSSAFFETVQLMKPALFAVDEAHCISSWGHDFRPEYLKLGVLKERFPAVPLIALTASADERTRRDIMERLAIGHAQQFLSSFNRPNIWYYILPKKKAADALVAYVGKRKDECGIVYTLSRAGTEQIAALLLANGVRAASYHAGMDSAARARVQEDFQNDKINVVVATIAFGMGIDKSNVRFVVHYDVPKSIEGYYQETGRAGRDGLKSEALLFYTIADIIKLKGFVQKDGSDPAQTDAALKKLKEMELFCEHQGCRRQYLLQYFGEQSPPYCGSCDFCLGHLEEREVTIPAQKVLSAISRTGEKFGTGYIIDFLRGSASAAISSAHRELKTYGIGRDLSKEEWEWIIKQLLYNGSLTRTDDPYQSLRLNEKSWAILKGDVEVRLVTRKASAVETTPVEMPTYEAALLQQLRQLRNELAEREQVPPYNIVPDNTLQELATYLPVAAEDLRQITGLGDYKVKRYGGYFSHLISTYMQENGVQTRMEQKARKKETPAKKPAGKNGTQLITLHLLREGMSVTEIAEHRGLSPTTIEGHIAHFIERGELDILQLISPARLDDIESRIGAQTAGAGLKDIRQRIGEDISFAEIKWVLAHQQAGTSRPPDR